MASVTIYLTKCYLEGIITNHYLKKKKCFFTENRVFIINLIISHCLKKMFIILYFHSFKRKLFKLMI